MINKTVQQYSQKCRRTSTYYPQTNGLAEYLNKFLTDMLATYVGVEHKTWVAILLHVTFAYNTAVKEIMSMTPFKLVYRRNPVAALDAMLLTVSYGENLGVAA